MNSEKNPLNDDQQSSLRRMTSGALSILLTRLELLGIELTEEKERLLLSVFIGLAGMLLSLMALITLTVLIAALFWNTYRWQALAVLTCAYFLAAIFCGLKALSRLRNTETLFSATLTELKKDHAALQASKQPQQSSD